MFRLRYRIALAVVLLVAGVVVAPTSARVRDDTAIDDEQTPSSTARSFTRTRKAGSSLSPAAWRPRLARYPIAASFDGVNPDRVPAHTLTGVPSLTSTARRDAVIDVPTDTGTLVLGRRAADGDRLVDSVDWIRA